MSFNNNYFKVPNSVFGLNLSHHELLVLVFLLKFGEHSYPSQATIAKKVGIGVTSVKKALGELSSRSLVSWTKGNSKKSNTYILNIEKIAGIGTGYQETNRTRQEPGETFAATAPLAGESDADEFSDLMRTPSQPEINKASAQDFEFQNVFCFQAAQKRGNA